MGEWFLKIRPGFLFASVGRGVLKSQVGVTDSQAEDLSLRRSLDSWAYQKKRVSANQAVVYFEQNAIPALLFARR